MLDGSPDFRLLKEASDVGSLLSGLRILNPHVVLLDGTLVRGRGIGVIEDVLASTRSRRLKILVTVEKGDEGLVLAAVGAGASGAVCKESPARVIMDGILQAACGKLILPQTVIRGLVDVYRRRHLSAPVRDSSLCVLTCREAQVVRLVASGLSNTDIARRFVLSESTIKTHLNRAMRKLHLTSRSAVVVYAYENHLVRPGHGLAERR